MGGSCPSPVVLGDGENQSVARTIQDQAGNQASLTVGPLSVDLTAPTNAAHGDENAEATSPSGALVSLVSGERLHLPDVPHAPPRQSGGDERVGRRSRRRHEHVGDWPVAGRDADPIGPVPHERVELGLRLLGGHALFEPADEEQVVRAGLLTLDRRWPWWWSSARDSSRGRSTT
jgi:hypothetical protein